MKNHPGSFVALAALAVVVYTLRAPGNRTDYDTATFGALPVLVNGRIKPLDTVARSTLLTLQGRQRVVNPEGRELAPAEWLLDVFYRRDVADHYATFEITHPDVLAIFNLASTDGVGGKRFSATQLAPSLGELDRQARLADGTESAARTAFQRAVIQLRDNVLLYQRLQSTAMAADMPNYFEQVARLRQLIASNRVSGSVGDDAKFVAEMTKLFGNMDTLGELRLVPGSAGVPPASGTIAGETPALPGGPSAAGSWKTIGAGWTEVIGTRKMNDATNTFAELGAAWRAYNPAAFNHAVQSYRAFLDTGFPAVMRKCDVETRFNSAQPFYTSMVLYVLAFLLGVVSWLKWPDLAGRAAFALVSVAYTVTTVGIVTRMWLEARPPVTNLYSSALFVGWGAVVLCLVLEGFFRNAIGSVAAGLIGFATLLIAHHLSLGGDTLEMMRAVLDSNFWLATHVVTVTVGYSATFLAGFLAVIYVVRGALTRSLDRATADALARMVYGIVCFATLFSFVGTILGGIWADQSWGRFWGWDPKENGALIIVIWNSIILHARWGGYVKQRGLMALAIFGNVVTAWSWFGVNMLGVGLHSYGFMDAAFWWLVGFAVSQAVIIAICAMPRARWRSVIA